MGDVIFLTLSHICGGLALCLSGMLLGGNARVVFMLGFVRKRNACFFS